MNMIAVAIALVTKIRTSALNARACSRGIIAGVFGGLNSVADTEPVPNPLPDVTGHVVEAIPVGRKGIDGCGADEAVLRRVPEWKIALPDIHRVPAAGHKRVSPWEILTRKTSARRIFPFRLRRQPQAGPVAISHGIVPGDVYHRMGLAARDSASGAFRFRPIRTIDLSPPRQARWRLRPFARILEKKVEHE